MTDVTHTILVAHASRYGSTREVAERVGDTLRNLGHAVEVRPARSVSDLSRYSAVILGTAYYYGKMLKAGAAFLERHRGALEAMPTALFALGPVSAANDPSEARGQIEATLAQLGWLTPVATEMFGGKYDPTAVRGLDKVVTKLKASPMHGLEAHDGRDWSFIECWAKALPDALRLARPTRPHPGGPR
jgi:menaquinone-dependent protoporphyrinogen oxidase